MIKARIEIVRRYLVDFSPDEWEAVREEFGRKRGLDMMQPYLYTLDPVTLRVHCTELLRLEEEVVLNAPTD